MTYDEAVSIKENNPYPKSIPNSHLVMYLFVTPEMPKDFEAYVKAVTKRFNTLKDEDSIVFSLNNGFALRWMMRMGGDLLYENFKVNG